jgi:hypothetical protein
MSARRVTTTPAPVGAPVGAPTGDNEVSHADRLRFTLGGNAPTPGIAMPHGASIRCMHAPKPDGGDEKYDLTRRGTEYRFSEKDAKAFLRTWQEAFGGLPQDTYYYLYHYLTGATSTLSSDMRAEAVTAVRKFWSLALEYGMLRPGEDMLPAMFSVDAADGYLSESEMSVLLNTVDDRVKSVAAVVRQMRRRGRF